MGNKSVTATSITELLRLLETHEELNFQVVSKDGKKKIVYTVKKLIETIIN